jgi:enoyl-CoA hydratase/carnithine racemase
LTRLVGPARAKDIIWSGRQVRAEEAHAIGLVDRLATPGEEEHAALHWASELGKGAVVAMGLAKHAIDDGLGRRLAEGLDLERAAFIEVFGTADAKTGVQSFLAERPGKAKFSGS